MTWQIDESLPGADEFVRLRERVGWGAVDRAVAQRALSQSLYSVTVRDGDTLVGMGRVIGDNALYYYVQDVAVDPAWQGRGVGLAVMAAIEGYLAESVPVGSCVGLLAAEGKEAFYTPFGYTRRDGSPLGHGMSKVMQPA